jgi:DNA-binding FadR family transcriptional regulator
LTINQMPLRHRWINGSGAEESRLRRWASAAFPLFCALFVLSLPAIDSGTFGRTSGAFANEGAAMAFVAASIVLLVVLGAVATPASEHVLGFFRGGGGTLSRERPTGAVPLDFVPSASVSTATVGDLLEVRSALLAFVAGLAARNARDQEIEGLAELVDALAARRQGADGADGRLDHRLVEVCGNAAAREIFVHCDRRLRWCGSASVGTTAAEWGQTMRDWRGLIEALRSRDPTTAEAIARRMARRSRSRLADGPAGD